MMHLTAHSLTTAGLMAWVVAAVPVTAEASRENACWNGDGPARLWPDIRFEQAADLDDYRRTMAQSRDEVRRNLEQELVGVLSVLTEAGGKPEELLDPAFSALMAFDGLHDRHREHAVRGIPAYLDAAFRSRLEKLYRSHAIPAAERRLLFANGGLVERLRIAGQSGDGAPTSGQQRLMALQQVAAAVDLTASGTFSGDGTRHHVTLSLEDVHSGAVCGYEADGDLDQIASRLAEAVFNDFEAVGYPAARDPNPHLTWIQPVNQETVVSTEVAWSYCESQGEGVRLPYSLELTRAAQVGTEGASYVEGGIPSLTPGLWMVADHLRREDQYYYVQPRPGGTDDHPAGPVRTAAGLGTVQARFWCVKGTPEERVVRVEELYALYRNIAWQAPDSPALAAVEYLLHRNRALSAEKRFARAFPSEALAWAAIENSGCSLAGAPTDGLLLAALPRCVAEGEQSSGRDLPGSH